ncbi:hypothetical protein BDR03DRAFT_381434 [Suillus americanus]|nr:hypothetical protein BDR03DRAFT_381434 [Suillus americanus]
MQVVMIARLHAIYQRSRMMLIFLVIIFLAVNIACGVVGAIALKDSAAEEVTLSGTYMCNYEYEGGFQLLASMVWTLNTVWEVLALCLSVWIAVKHFRDLRRFGPSTGLTTGDCFRVLIKSHVLYFASVACVSCLELGYLSLGLSVRRPVANISCNTAHHVCRSQIPWKLRYPMVLFKFYWSCRCLCWDHAKLVADSDAEVSMDSTVFQERVYVPTSSIV